MLEVLASPEFETWLDRLGDIRAQRRISDRLLRVAGGLMGDVKYFDGIGELRVDYGPGYRLYFVRRGQRVVVLLCGGDKASQARDIAKARVLAKEY